MAEVIQCDICGGELPAALVEETTAATIAPLEAAMCEVCQLVQDHTQPDGNCIECGDAVASGHYIEIEFPCGVADVPARVSGSLCGKCAADHAFRINYRSVENDEDAGEQYTDLVDKQAQARRKLEGSA